MSSPVATSRPARRSRTNTIYRGNWGQGCALPSHEVQMEYILQCCRKMQEDRIKCMEPKQNVTTQLNLYMDARHAKVYLPIRAQAVHEQQRLTICSNLFGLRIASRGTKTTKGMQSFIQALFAPANDGQERPRIHLARQPTPPPQVPQTTTVRTFRNHVRRPGQHLRFLGQCKFNEQNALR